MIPELSQNKYLNPQEMSELIGLIYDAAMDENQWSMLTQVLSSTIAELTFETTNQHNKNHSHDPNFDIAIFLEHCYNKDQSDDLLDNESKSTQLTSKYNITIGETLLPHFERAARLNQNLNHTNQINETLESVLDHVPIGIILADSEGKVIGKNNQADIVLLKTNFLTISNNKIVTNLSDKTKLLHNLISKACMNNQPIEEDSETLIMKNNYGNLPFSLLITPAHSKSTNKSHAIIFIAAPEMYADIPLERLQKLYDLTIAESRSLKALVNGKDLKTISNENEVAISTTRSHLKAIFSKTNTSRQSELIRLVLTSPAIVSENVNTSKIKHTNIDDQTNKNSLSFNTDDHFITLADGRTLCYREYGAPDGFPVIFMHTAPASRQQMHSDTELSTKLGIRLIVPDRPGFGLSTPKPDRKILDWCDDIKQLLKHTGINEFGVIGYGSGTPYALAVAATYPDAVKHISILSAVLPDYSLRDLRGLDIIPRMIYITARNIPSVLVQMVKQSAKFIKKDMNKYIVVMKNYQSELDQQLLSDPAVMLNLKIVLLDATSLNGRHYAQDILLQVRNWEFDLAKIETPVRIWHGEHNNQNPIKFAINLSQLLPKCELIRLRDAGHFLIYSKYWKQALCNAAGLDS